jgi:LuxR family transcriptional regulator, maltose regulon positive regulatory protein
MLESLAHSNLFLVSLDGRGEWYRYHHLFSDLLHLELRHSDPSAERSLRLGASAWCREQGLVEEAIEHASAAGDHALVAEMLLEQHRPLLRTGRNATLLRHVDGLPQEILFEHPELAAVAALASGLLSGPAAERRRFVAIAERVRVEQPEAWSPYAQAAVSIARAAWIDGDVGLSVENGRRAAELGRQCENEITVPALAALAYALYLAGDLGAALTAAREAIDRPEAPERPHGLLYALATLSILETEDGRARAGEATARQALAIVRRSGLSGAWSAGHAYVALACALDAQGNLRQAELEAERGEALRRAADECVEQVHALLVLARIRVARGQLLLAANNLASARESIAGFADPGRLSELAGAVGRALEEARLGARALIEEPTPAELTVLRLLATELSQREIGAQLHLSLNTVKTHTRGIYRKLGVTSREEAVTRASGLGLLEEPQSPG